jgi:hypothetical protein
MRHLLLAALLCLSASVSYAQVCFFKVDFQDVYSEDTVSFWVNGQAVFSDQVLISDPSLGLTDMILVFVNVYEGTYSVKVTPGMKREISPWIKFKGISSPSVLTFKIKVNGLVHEEKVNLAKGRFIGIATHDGSFNTGIFIEQWKRPFFYD